MFIIYKHTSPSGKSYIGQTKAGFEHRWKAHQAAAKYGKDTAFCRAISKYGAENFTSEILQKDLSEDQVNEAERYWIEFYSTYTKGYNMTEGGGGRAYISEEQKEAIRKSNSTREISNQTKKRMSEAAKNRGPHIQKTYDKASRSKSKLANIFSYKTDELLYENVYLFEWVREHPECKKEGLIKTANPNSRTKQHKGYYVRWVDKQLQEKN